MLRKRLIIAALLAISPFVANADPIQVTPDADVSFVGVNITGCILSCEIAATLSDSLDGATATLAIGESWTFDFFDVVVGGLGIGEAIFEASLAFIAPEIFVAESEGYSLFGSINGWFSGGILIWDDIGSISLADGSVLTITFEDIAEIGFGNSTTVSATVTRSGGSGGSGGTSGLNSTNPNPVSVTEPGTLALLGLGLVGIGLARRRKIV